MQAGELREPTAVLELQNADTVYSWGQVRKTWAKAEPQAQKALFSQIGVGAKSVKFTVRKQDITLNSAFSWHGKHCFLTDINEIDRLYYEIQAALVEPKICAVTRLVTTKDSLNRPERTPQVILTFPGCVTEKYMGFTRLNPQNQEDAQYVLVAPKAIYLQPADLVKIGDITYNVQITHETDEFKNEYEIAVKRDI